MPNSNKLLNLENEDENYNPVIKSIALNHNPDKNYIHDSGDIEYFNSNTEPHMNFVLLKN